MNRWTRGLLLLVHAVLLGPDTTGGAGTAPRPEFTLLDLLAKPFAPTEGASTKCLRDSQIYFAELAKYNPWALQMYDASAKIPPGIINGNIQQLGNYDECLKIKTGHNFEAQACSASVQFEILKGQRTTEELDMKDLIIQVAKASDIEEIPEHSVYYEWMWCVPSTCNHFEISEALEFALDPLKVDGRLDFTVSLSENSCHTVATDSNSFDTVDWSYTGLMLIFLVIIVISTIYDLYLQRKTESTSRGIRHSVLTSFSLYSNGKKLLSTSRSDDSINCLDGLRYICICWIIFGHTFYIEAVGVKMDRSNIPKLHENWSSMLVLNANIFTDAFFLISGILLSFTSLTKSSKDGNSSINIFHLYLNRYLRLTPAYAVVIGFYATLYEKLGSGLKWNTWIHTSKEDCRANWWTNLLYINNYVNIERICMSQSWYLSVDMQLLLISPIFLYPLMKLNKSIYFWTITGVGILLSVLVPFFVTYTQHLTGTMLYYKNQKDVTDVYLQIYTRVYTRAGPFIIGLVSGLILFKTKGYKIRIASIHVWCGWLIASIAVMSSILLPREMYFDDHVYNKYEAGIYAGLHRHLFAMSLFWIIFACVNGYAGPLNAFLSWRAWVPLSKMSYCAYLTHYIVLLYNIGSERTASSMTLYTSIHTFFGNLCLTMMISLVLCCCFEMPFMTISRLVLSPRRSKTSRLPTQPSAELIFGSTDSADRIGSSSENIAGGSKTSSVDSVFVIAVGGDTPDKPANPDETYRPLHVAIGY